MTEDPYRRSVFTYGELGPVCTISDVRHQGSLCEGPTFEAATEDLIVWKAHGIGLDGDEADALAMSRAMDGARTWGGAKIDPNYERGGEGPPIITVDPAPRWPAPGAP